MEITLSLPGTGQITVKEDDYEYVKERIKESHWLEVIKEMADTKEHGDKPYGMAKATCMVLNARRGT